MRAAAWLLLSGGLIAAQRSEAAALQTLRWQVVEDSVQVEFGFVEGRPARYRVQASVDTASEKSLVVEFAGTRVDHGARLKLPKWMHLIEGPDTSLLAIQIRLNEATPWKANWDGNALRMNILNRVHTNPAWKNPWLVGGLGTAVLAGGIVFWLSGSERSKPGGDNVIPPPGVVFPQ